MFVTLTLLNVVTELPEIDCVDVPFKTSDPVPAVNVPSFVKSLETFKVDGDESVPEMVSPPKLVALLPAIDEDPLKITVPPLLVNVPLFVHVPATLMVEDGAVKVLEGLMTMLLNELVLEPLIRVEPPKVTVLEPEFKVPLFTKLPLIFRLEVGVKDPVIVIFPKVGTVLPVTIVVPENVMALDVKVDELLLIKFPFKSMALLPALKIPEVKVNTPFTVTAELRLIASALLIVRFLKSVVLVGSSGPVAIAEPLELV